jgi:uncharacterized protein YecT (DUF1311 family)
MIPTRNLTRAALLLSAFGAALCGPALAAEPWKPDADIGCQDKVTTVGITECLNARTKVWDARLNQAYKALIGMLQADPSGAGRLNWLRAAQRLWLQYRKANCDFYAAEQGTMRQIDAAECMRRMTQDRAIELQQAGPQG